MCIIDTYFKKYFIGKTYNTGDHVIVIIFEKDNSYIEYDGLKRPTLKRVKKCPNEHFISYCIYVQPN